MVKALTDVKTLGGQIVSDFESIKTTPLNMRIQAAHLGERASSLSVISSNYQILASQIKEIIEEFMQSAEAVLKTVKEGLFLSCISGFQSESINAFAVETNLPDFIDREAEIALLTHQNAKYNKQALEGFARISKEINHFTELSVSLKRILSGLSLTRILCEMESKRIGHDARNMSDIAAQLSDFQNSTGRCLKEIEEQNLQLQNALKGQTATTKKTTSQTAITRFAAA
jgi:aerotaxis receptor